MKRNRSLFVTTVFFVTFGIFLTGHAEEEKKSFVVGVENTSYLPHYTYDDNTYGGYARAVLDAFAERKGYTFTYEGRPVARLYVEYIEWNKFDFKYPDNPVWAGDMKKNISLTYSEPVVYFTDGVWVLPENKEKGVAPGFVLGTIRGFTAQAYLDDIEKGTVKLEPSNLFTGLIKKVLSGRVDGAYISQAVGTYYLEKVMNEHGELVFDKSLPHITDSFHLSSINHPEVIKAFNEFLKTEAELVRKLKKEFNVGKEVFGM